MTFTAQWKVNSYSVTFDAAGGAGGLTTNLAYGAALKAPASPSRTGYSFTGWKPAVPSTMPASNATFTAQWKINSYAIAFDSNGGGGSMARQEVSYGESVALAGNSFTRKGYAFAGWAKTADGAADYKDGQSVSNLSTAQGATVTLYAVWEPIGYTVSFSANGGSGTMRAQAMTYDQSAALTSNVFTRAGFAFAGWAKTADGSVYYDDGQSVRNLASEEGAVASLYAVWEVNSYFIAFDGNGGSGTAMETIQAAYTDDVRLPENTFVRTGYSYSGWAAKANARSPDYAERATVSKLSAVNRSTVTLYAVWTANVYSVSFDPAGGSACEGMTLAYDSAYAGLPVPERVGYAFDGWHDDAGDLVEETTKMTTAADTTLHARWTPVSYAVAFDANGGGGTMSRQVMAYDAATNLSRVAYSRVGHAFVDWNTSADGSGTAYADGQAVSNLTAEADAVVTLFAQWSAFSYKVSFDANGGSGDEVFVVNGQGATNEVPYGESFSLPACTYERPGRAFKGWRIGSATFEAGAAVSNLAATAGAQVTIKASWGILAGELSQALDVETLAFATEGGWSVVTNETAAGGTCLRSSADGATAKIAAQTDVGGTVTFNWKMFYSSPRQATNASVDFWVDAGEGTNLLHMTREELIQSDEWETVSLVLPEGASSIAFRFNGGQYRLDSDGPYYILVDSVAWRPTVALGDDQYGIVFKGGAGAEGEMETMICDSGRVYALPANGFSSPGRAFAGWCRLDDGRRYDDGVFVFDLAADGCLVELEAVWVPSGE